MNFWSPARVARLERLAETGLSAALIGKYLGCSKSAVIGKCWRKHIPLLATETLPGGRKTHGRERVAA